MNSIIKKSGFTLLETLIYAAGLLILLSGMVAMVVFLYGWYRDATMPTRVDQVGITLINKIGNDIRGSNVVNDGNSVFNVQNGAISATATYGNVSTTTRYYLDGTTIKSRVNNGVEQMETPSDVKVTGFFVKKLVTQASLGIKIQLLLEYKTKTETTTRVYDNFIVLRQSYN